MSTYHATIKWTRGNDEFLKQKYSRGHTWHFDEGITVPASASPHVLRAPLSVAAAVGFVSLAVRLRRRARLRAR